MRKKKKRRKRDEEREIVGGMILGLLMGCNNGEIAKLEKKSSFYESVVKIGQGFQEIFGIFGNAMGDVLGFNAVKSTDKRSAVGEHFKKIGKGLQSTKDRLDGLAREISFAPNTDTKGVEAVISSAGEVIGKLITAVTKLAEVTNSAPDSLGGTVASTGGVPALAAEYFTGLASGVEKTIQALVEIGNKMQEPSENEQKSVSFGVIKSKY